MENQVLILFDVFKVYFILAMLILSIALMNLVDLSASGLPETFWRGWFLLERHADMQRIFRIE